MIFETKGLQFRDINYQDLCLQKGKTNFVVGESGCGKSTLLKMFNQTVSPSSGKIYYNGVEIDAIDTITLRREVSLISQEVFLFDTTIEENFKSFYQYRGLVPPTKEEIEKICGICCVDFPVDKDCTVMSGGERHRIYTAIFLSFKPKVIMLDEPTSALDEKNSFEVIRNVIHFCKHNQIEIIVVSHDRALTTEFSEHIIKLGKDDELYEWRCRA